MIKTKLGYKNKSKLRKFAGCDFFFFLKNKIKKKQFFVFLYICERQIFIYIYISLNDKIVHCETRHYCSAKFHRLLRNLISQPEKIDFATCEISQVAKFWCPASHCIKILIKTAKINMKKLRKFAEK